MKLRSPSWAVTPTTAAAGVALWLITVDNFSFWKGFWRAQPASIEAFGAAVAQGVVLWLLMTSVLRLLGPPRFARVVWAALLLCSAIAAHFVDGWGVLLEKSMLRNVLETDVREAGELITSSFAIDFLLRGALPAVVLLLVPLRPSSSWEFLKSGAVIGVAAVALLAGALAVFYQVYASTYRNHRELRLQLVPSNYLGALYGLLKPRRAERFMAVAEDAKRNNEGRSPLLFVLVLGETARADNFSLGGYERPTNAALQGKDVVYFSNVTSCGTDTATSLPCMFSNLGVDGFSNEKAFSRENVLDVLQRTGVQVRWIGNNSGCKEVCRRVPTVNLSENETCKQKGECFDEGLVEQLASQMPPPDTDALVVLHQRGSHGPAYFKRFPSPARFKPICTTQRLQDCDREAIVNTYDNTIDYTSKVLSAKIDELTRLAGDRDTVLLYLSDHGESLGERGIYLHGMPRWMAPHEQLHVPMLIWMNEGAKRRLAARQDCIASMAAAPLSHDNLFHSLLGAFDVSTAAYKAELDIFKPLIGSGRCWEVPTKLSNSHYGSKSGGLE